MRMRNRVKQKAQKATLIRTEKIFFKYINNIQLNLAHTRANTRTHRYTQKIVFMTHAKVHTFGNRYSYISNERE